ncbi:MAG: head GIN domain-containing protein [Croceibacterium sp.]
MGFKHVLKAVAPVVALAIAGSLAGCEKANVNFNGEEGKQLSELDLSGEAPREVSLLGADTVDIRDGEKLAIQVEGSDEAKDRVRFVLKDGSLGILRKNGSWSDDQVATVIVTMPAPAKLNLAGSGKITAASVSDHPEINVAGSGTLALASVSAAKMEVNIAGSGSLKAAGSAEKLDLNVLGSGSADLSALKVGSAKVNVAGSGKATFASDGDVDANIMGSGDVTVRGRARCKVKTIGSGSLICEGGETGADKTD